MNINVDLGKDYHTQRNNAIRPGITCASTSMAMALIYSGYEKDLNRIVPAGMQEEDFITNFIHTDKKVIDFWSKHPQRWIRDSWLQYKEYEDKKRESKETTFGNEIHEVMAFAINVLFGDGLLTKIDDFSYAMPIKDILFNLVKGGAVVVSGRWPSKSGSMAHVVCLTGFSTKQEDILNIKSAEEIDMSKVNTFNIDDPYGDYHTLYSSQKGNDVVMSREDFFSILNEPGVFTAKRAHLIKAKN